MRSVLTSLTQIGQIYDIYCHDLSNMNNMWLCLIDLNFDKDTWGSDYNVLRVRWVIWPWGDRSRVHKFVNYYFDFSLVDERLLTQTCLLLRLSTPNHIIFNSFSVAGYRFKFSSVLVWKHIAGLLASGLWRGWLFCRPWQPSCFFFFFGLKTAFLFRFQFHVHLLLIIT